MLSLISVLALCLVFPLKMFAWDAGYAEVLAQAQQQQKPLLIAFVGSEWCPWSDKLLSEVLKQPEFTNSLKEAVVFVRVNFPYEEVNPESEKLKEKFHVRQLPTLVLASPKEEEIAKMGYLPLKPSEFSVHVERILHGYNKLVAHMNEADLNRLPIEEVRHLYRESCLYNLPKFKEVALAAGLLRDDTPFFLLEKYAQLVKAAPKKAKAVREQIETLDPENTHGAQLQLAVIDFNTRAETSDEVQKVLKPLRKYLKEFGPSDQTNSWRVHMMIAQYLFHKKENKAETIKSAETAIDLAPEASKSELRDFLNYMKENLLTQNSN